MTAIVSKNMLQDILVDFLPASQHPYKHSKSYIALCDALYNYLTSDFDTKEEKRQILEHSKEIFDHLTKTTEPPTPQSDPERQTLKPWHWK